MMLELPGVDGTNPLGFVAALGVVAVAGGRLSWIPNGGSWTPVVSLAVKSRVALVDLLHERLRVMPFAYTFAETGEPPYADFKEKKAEEGVNAKRKSKDVRVVTESVFRAALERCADDPAEMERLAAHTCATALRDGVQVRNTAVRSASGQIRYLDNLRAIVKECGRNDLDRALFGEWDHVQAPKLGLDPKGLVENISYNISKLGSIAEIGAERLALEGLRGLPTSIHRGRLVTRGYNRDGTAFRWALSTTPRSFHATSGLLGAKRLFDDDLSKVARWASAVGVAAVYESAVEWYGKGYKMLGPSIRAA